MTGARVAVIVASAGRPELLAQVVESCGAQSRTFRGILTVPDEASLPPESQRTGWEVVTGVRGAAAQRNAALDRVGEVDAVAFFDDDALLRPDYLANALDFLDTHPEVVALTGRVLIDGAVSGEIPVDVSLQALEKSSREELTGRWQKWRQLYGCNFVMRREVVVAERFDGRLPLYSWLEDHDLARRALRHGRLARVEDCVIVHRAATSGGRQAHVRLGYSQVINAIYLWRKGSFPLWLMVEQIGRVAAKNAALSVAGGQARWRRQRLKGNTLAALDAARGRIAPETAVRY